MEQDGGEEKQPAGCLQLALESGGIQCAAPLITCTSLWARV